MALGGGADAAISSARIRPAGRSGIIGWTRVDQTVLGSKGKTGTCIGTPSAGPVADDGTWRWKTLVARLSTYATIPSPSFCSPWLFVEALAMMQALDTVSRDVYNDEAAPHSTGE